MAVLQDYRDFWREIAIPDYEEFHNKIDDLRRAFHCAIGLFHMADWVHVAHSASINASLTFKDKNGNAAPVLDEKTFANALRDLCPEFELVRGIANSAKHLVLKNPGPLPASPTHAANTVVRSTGWGEGAYGVGPYGGTPRVMLQGPGGKDLEFLDLATAVVEMWRQLSAKHGWKIEG